MHHRNNFLFSIGRMKFEYVQICIHSSELSHFSWSNYLRNSLVRMFSSISSNNYHCWIVANYIITLETIASIIDWVWRSQRRRRRRTKLKREKNRIEPRVNINHKLCLLTQHYISICYEKIVSILACESERLCSSLFSPSTCTFILWKPNTFWTTLLLSDRFSLSFLFLMLD